MPQQHHWLNAHETGDIAPEVAKVMAAAITGPITAPTSRRRRDLVARARAAVEAKLELGEGYEVVFTSGAEEADAHVVTEAVQNFNVRTGMVAQVIISAADASAVAACCHRLRAAGRAKVVRVPVRPAGDPLGAGTVDPEGVQGAIRPDTCLISIEAVNPVTGAPNDLRMIGAVAARATVPFHSNLSLALLAGEAGCRPAALGLGAASLDFHRAGGPPGVGVLALQKRFAAGYEIRPLVPGLGPQALRGGPVAAHLVVGALETLRRALHPAPGVAAALRRAVGKALGDACDLGDYLASRRARKRARVVWLTGRLELRNEVVMMAVPGAQREELAEHLEQKGYWVRVPRDDELDCLDLPPRLYQGALSVAARGADAACAAGFAAALASAAPARDE